MNTTEFHALQHNMNKSTPGKSETSIANVTNYILDFPPGLVSS